MARRVAIPIVVSPRVPRQKKRVFFAKWERHAKINRQNDNDKKEPGGETLQNREDWRTETKKSEQLKITTFDVSNAAIDEHTHTRRERVTIAKSS